MTARFHGHGQSHRHCGFPLNQIARVHLFKKCTQASNGSAPPISPNGPRALPIAAALKGELYKKGHAQFLPLARVCPTSVWGNRKHELRIYPRVIHKTHQNVRIFDHILSGNLPMTCTRHAFNAKGRTQSVRPFTFVGSAFTAHRIPGVSSTPHP